MTKIVINTCHGGFGISAKAESKYRELAGLTDPDFHSRLIPRDDAHLIAVVELISCAVAPVAPVVPVVPVWPPC